MVARSPDMQRALKAYHSKHCPRTLQQYAGVIIEMTAPDHVTPKMKNKYVTAIQYAHREGIKPSDFVEFIRDRGGSTNALTCGGRTKSSGAPALRTSRSG